MEMFGDLSELCQANVGKAQQSVTDELNTPVFEKASFNYDRPLPRSDLLDVTASLEDQFNYKIKNELSSMNTVNINDTNNIIIQEDSNVFPENNGMTNMSTIVNTGADNLNYVVISSQDLNDKTSNAYVPCHVEYNNIIYSNSNNTVTPIYELVCEDEEYLPTVNSYTDIFFNNNSNSNTNDDPHPHSDEFIKLEATSATSPDLSKSSVDCSNSNSSLALDLDDTYKNVDSLDTPDVIETIDAIESEKAFNILNFITEEDFSTAEPIFSPLDITPFFPTTSEQSNCITKQTRKRKIKTEDSDDEDYQPPSSYKRIFGSNRKLSKLVFNSENEEVNKPIRRGRPPKQYSSNVSECNSESGEKYREMRDKNNEASRKSRHKRKLKECAQEEEAQELEENNIKLKAQVAELERTVNNFRTNLMQILLKK
ncbi:hypothetical protein RI129_001082 [Pyrocoelia pectoralis]|uniref:BZIP domain-containing protein n=1 Tax=Pyrocoelia pectoralis TaxID=417401 RepID=A0AAN7VVT0_9COLE